MIDRRDGVQHKPVPSGPEYFPQNNPRLPDRDNVQPSQRERPKAPFGN